MRLRGRSLANAGQAYREGAWRDAAAQAKSILLAEPGRTEAMVLLARAESRLGRNEAARALYHQLDPRGLQAEDYFLVGRGLIAEGQVGEGMVGLDRALQLEPRHAETLVELIRINLRTDRLSIANIQAASLATVPGFEARGQVLLGLVRQDLHDPQAAAKAFRSALSRDPKLAGVTEGSVDEVRKWLARSLLQAGRPAEAQAELESFLASRGDDPEASWLLSRAALQQHDVATAGCDFPVERLQYRSSRGIRACAVRGDLQVPGVPLPDLPHSAGQPPCPDVPGERRSWRPGLAQPSLSRPREC